MSVQPQSRVDSRAPVRPVEPEVLAGRYLVLHEIGMGGMARVQLGRVLGPGGFVKPVAVKRLHPHLVGDPGFVTLILDEARLAARVRHPNVVGILDVLEVADPDATQDGEPALTEVLLVLEYVEGETLRRLLAASLERGELLDTSLVVSIMSGVLHGLHAAHRAMDAQGQPLELVHRDVSPQNILLGSDGVARVLDFGIAKGTGRIQSTRDGEIKGKLRYMAPEQVLNTPIDARCDIFAAGAVLFEALTGEPLIHTATQAEGMDLLLRAEFPRLAEYDPALEPFQPVLDRALQREPDQRYGTALEFAIALQAVQAPAPHHEVATWLEGLARDHLAKRRKQLLEVETLDLTQLPTPPRELLDSSSGWPRPSRITPAFGSSAVRKLGTESGNFTSFAPAPQPVKTRRTLWPVLGFGLLAVSALAWSLRPGAESAPPPSEPPGRHVASEGGSDGPLQADSPAQTTAEPAQRALSSAVPSAEPRPAPAPASTVKKQGGPARAPRPKRASPARAKPQASPPATRPECLAPVTVDDNGIKHIKPECL
ncbi:MAG: serine/threonine protein kinase [Myxococcales bacterium]|nr:serine/threonine protein kinase [Myxococcales bacterium]